MAALARDPIGAFLAHCGAGILATPDRNRALIAKEIPVIKSISLLTRKAGLSQGEFIRHWVEVHAPLAHAVPGLRRYVQSHIRAEPTRPDIPTAEIAVDGIAELWFDDQAAMERAHASPEAKRLFADGALFIGRIKTFIVEERVIIPSEPG